MDFKKLPRNVGEKIALENNNDDEIVVSFDVVSLYQMYQLKIT